MTDKFLVVKWEWLEESLSDKELHDFYYLLTAATAEKPEHKYYVVNKDEPYSEQVGELIEKCERKKNLPDGKIGISNEIINKASKLNEEEYTLIKSHPEIGANILKDMTEIEGVSIGAHWHHERYDGTGYPDGLSGEGIPEIARIISVVDAYDTMTSKRSYRDVLPQHVAKSEIEKGKGTQFDPHFAEIMLQMIEEDKEYQLRERS